MKAGPSICEGVVALLGHPVFHSLSPQMQNAAFLASGIPYCYIAFDVRPGLLAAAVAGMKALGFRGANVTIPHKVEVMNHLDEVEATAAEIGAVNTIVVGTHGKLVGYNTDAAGLLEALRCDTSFDSRDKSALILGAGGAARACAFALASAGVRNVVIVNRSLANAVSLEKALRKAYPACEVSTIVSTPESEMTSLVPFTTLEQAHLVINATPLGLWPEWTGQSPLRRDYLRLLPEDCVVVDLVYRPARTRLLEDAAGRGLRTVSGLSILLHQGALAFELWTGKPAPLDVMRAAIDHQRPVSEVNEE